MVTGPCGLMSSSKTEAQASLGQGASVNLISVVTWTYINMGKQEGLPKVLDELGYKVYPHVFIILHATIRDLPYGPCSMLLCERNFISSQASA